MQLNDCMMQHVGCMMQPKGKNDFWYIWPLEL